MQLAVIAAILFLVFTHLFVNKLQLSGIPRSKWLSFAGGISVAYIFVRMLPEMRAFHEEVSNHEALQAFLFVDHAVYLSALLGLSAFYGLERMAKLSHQSQGESEGAESENIEVFWTHILFFGIYNLIIGYLLVHREEESAQSLIFFAIAMAFHMVITDNSLADHYGEAYQHKGRWIITAALFIGWLLAVSWEFPRAYVGLVFAFIAGGIIMNVLKEEVPEDRKSNFWAFFAGAMLYSLLLLSV